MIVLLAMLPALAQDAPWDDRLSGPVVDLDAPSRAFPVEGVAIGPVGGSTGFAVQQASVAGTDGGTHAWSARLVVPTDTLQVGVTLPFASFGTPGHRAAGLGNLAVDLAWRGDGDDDALVGVRGHLPLGRAYTWVHDATQLWPGAGLEAYYLRAFGDGPTVPAVRASLGLNGAAPYAPYPSLFPTFSVAGLVQQRLTDQVAVVGEAALTWWDVSPFDLSVLLQGEPREGLRLRGGLTLPMASWVGWQPAPVPGEPREVTFHLQVQTAH